jgi:hypothetical protein
MSVLVDFGRDSILGFRFYGSELLVLGFNDFGRAW